MSATQLRAKLERLRPTDLVVVRALVRYYWLPISEIAAELKLGLDNVRARAKFAYAVLEVENRLHLYVCYSSILLEKDGG